MIKEIGSEFWNIPLSKNMNDVFPACTRWFISGTAALESIIYDLGDIKKVALPSWCCNCMITPFLKHRIEIVFYPVYMDEGHLVCDYTGINADCWLLLSYFGYTDQVDCGTPSGIIIRDMTHSIFSKQQRDANYYFGSLRKWAGYYTGGYVWSEQFNHNYEYPECDCSYVMLRKNAMKQKENYINGVSSSKSYLFLFEKGEDFLDNCNLMKAYSSDIENAKYLDIGFMKNRRRNNAKILLDGLKQWSMFPKLNEHDCPLFVPILINENKRMELRNYLRDHEIYCPIHWPIEKEHVLTERTRDLYDKELSIVCDQRYNEDDMRRILTTIFDSGVIC